MGGAWPATAWHGCPPAPLSLHPVATRSRPSQFRPLSSDAMGGSNEFSDPNHDNWVNAGRMKLAAILTGDMAVAQWLEKAMQRALPAAQPLGGP